MKQYNQPSNLGAQGWEMWHVAASGGLGGVEGTQSSAQVLTACKQHMERGMHAHMHASLLFQFPPIHH